MVVSLNYSLIPSPAAHYPIQPYISENAADCPDSGQKSIERHSRFRQPHLGTMAGGTHHSAPRSRYDNSRRLQFSDADQVGRLVDIYA